MECLNRDVAKIKALSYTTMIEPEVKEADYDKRTVNYVIENWNRVKNNIRRTGRDLTEDQVDTIMSDLVEYLRKGNDYDDISYGNTNSKFTIESYINVSIGFCVKRFKHEKSVEYKKMAPRIISDDNEEIDPLDKVADAVVTEQFQNIGIDLELSLAQAEYLRNLCCSEIDLYQLLYITFLTSKDSEGEQKRRTLLNAFGVTDKQLINIGKKISRNEDVKVLLSAITESIKQQSLDYVIDMIEKFVYNRECIKQAVMAL